MLTVCVCVEGGLACREGREAHRLQCARLLLRREKLRPSPSAALGLTATRVSLLVRSTDCPSCRGVGREAVCTHIGQAVLQLLHLALERRDVCVAGTDRAVLLVCRGIVSDLLAHDAIVGLLADVVDVELVDLLRPRGGLQNQKTGAMGSPVSPVRT